MRMRLLLVACLAALVAAGVAAVGGSAGGLDATRFRATPLTASDSVASPDKRAGRARSHGLVSVLVKLDVAPVASYDGDVPGFPATSPKKTGEKLDLESPASKRYLGYIHGKQKAFEARLKRVTGAAAVVHSYDVVYGGLSVLVPPSKVAELSQMEGVTDVQRDELLQPETDRSPQFIGAPNLWQKLGGQGSAGEGVIVGVLDTGVWPEHPSFSDPDPLGKPYAAPPPPPSGTRQCEFSGGANPGPAFTCNNKLIGADRFMATYDAVVGLLPGEFTTARDDNGHGSHTSSTAAGNRGVAASIFGVPRGTVSGIAPRAHVIMYKVCGNSGCFSSDSTAAVQKAIQDGVNVINFSISGGNNPYADGVSLAFLDAYNAGVFVAASAGNSGPAAETVGHREPWVTTVAASTADRAFRNSVTVTAGLNSLTLNGTSLTAGISTATQIVSAAGAPFNDPFCANSTADGAFAGKIVVCQRGAGIGRVQKGFDVLQRGAAGMVLYNDAANVTDLETDNHFLPTSHIQFADGQSLLAFLAANAGATATMTAGAAAAQQGDVMASFSSRGGPAQPLGISKPDITAPGVQILAANTPAPVDIASGPPGQLFQAIAGTSMSSPHIAGSAALVKDLNPTWTPGQIRSALMTTAAPGVVKEDGTTPADAFDDGSGRVALNKASDPGVTFDAPGADYLTFKNELYRANYPSLFIPNMPGAVTVQRTMKSVLTGTATWKLNPKAPADLKVTTNPGTITLGGGASATFSITVDATNVPLGQTRFATIEISSSPPRKLRFPVTVVRGQGTLPLTKSCSPASFPRNATTTCTLAISNPAFTSANVQLTDTLPSRLQAVAGSATGGATISGNTVTFNGSVPATIPPTVAIGTGSSPAGGYLPLSLFGIPPVDGVSDDSITNFNVPSFKYGGNTYTQIGFSSNGYAVIGGGSGPDNSINNQNFPDPNRPNNVLAPFWTDLNPAAAGALRIATLTDGSDTWIVLDWEGVREFSQPRLNSFQIWIGLDSDANPAEDISYAYGTIQGNGDGGFLSVGAENPFGNSGQNTYFNGTGTLPSNGTQLRVTTTPGSAGSATITFQAKGVSAGTWRNCASMTADLLTPGVTATSCFDGVVTP
jgi:subtilisin family serine protease